jgi:hypothetical protein
MSSGRFGAVKSDSIYHFFGNACTKPGKWAVMYCVRAVWACTKPGKWASCIVLGLCGPVPNQGSGRSCIVLGLCGPVPNQGNGRSCIVLGLCGPVPNQGNERGMYCVRAVCLCSWFCFASNTTGWNPINRYHATTFLYLSLTPVFKFRLVTVLLVSVLSRLRFVNGIVRVVVSYFVILYCLSVYSQYYLILCFHL